MSFTAFYKRNLGFYKLAIASNLEYRMNFFMDALLQPSITSIVEMVLWMAIFKGAQATTIGGFDQNSYLAYALWATFIARATVNWTYEFKMIEEIDQGSINGLLVRPMSYYEYYLSQLLGYKSITTGFSLLFPIGIILATGLPTQWDRFPAAMLLVFYYLFFVYSISFCIASLAFFFNKVQSLTVSKNLAMWLVTGELFPLDLMPDYLRKIFLMLPFSSGVYVPIGFLTGRIGWEFLWHGFASVTVGIIFFSALGAFLWQKGMRSYAGTGA
jgi:ABC-2 type transport system permease protein